MPDANHPPVAKGWTPVVYSGPPSALPFGTLKTYHSTRLKLRSAGLSLAYKKKLRKAAPDDGGDDDEAVPEEDVRRMDAWLDGARKLMEVHGVEEHRQMET